MTPTARPLLTVLLAALLLAHPAFAGSAADRLEEFAESAGGKAAPRAKKGDKFDALIETGTNPAAGHGIDTYVKDIEAHRAAQEAREAAEEKERLEEEGKKEQESLAKSCECILADNCRAPIEFVYYFKNGITVEERAREKKEQDDEFQEAVVKPFWEGVRAKEPICREWKAAGKKGNTEAFKARLAAQDKAVHEAQQRAAETIRQRDELIAADLREKQAAEKAAGEEAARKALADSKAVDKAYADKLIADKKAYEEEQARKRAEFKIVDTMYYDYQLDNGQIKTWCEDKNRMLREDFSTGRNQLISVGLCTCKPAGRILYMEWGGCEIKYSYKQYETMEK